jgi:fumarate reductase subunit D
MLEENSFYVSVSIHVMDVIDIFITNTVLYNIVFICIYTSLHKIETNIKLISIEILLTCFNLLSKDI